MPWIESHQSLGQHPKTIEFARLLGVSVPTAIGHLHLLWWWALDFAPEGKLGVNSELLGVKSGVTPELPPRGVKAPAEVVRRTCMYHGKAERLWRALIESGFLDETPDGVEIHDWYDYAGRLIDKRVANRQRMRASRALHVQNTNGARAGATVPTVPDLTVPDLPDPYPLPPSATAAEGGDAPHPGAMDEELTRTRPAGTKTTEDPVVACCPNFARTGEHWQFCPNAADMEVDS